MDIRGQYQMRSQYDGVSRQRAKLPPWHELGPDALARPMCRDPVMLQFGEAKSLVAGHRRPFALGVLQVLADRDPPASRATRRLSEVVQR
jgi:hypothetical protein